MKKNCLLLLTSIILLLTFISCDSLWRITGRESVSFTINLGDLSLLEAQTSLQPDISMQPRSSILYNGSINNTVEYTVSLHLASNDSEIATQTIVYNNDSPTIVRFDNVPIVGKKVYAKVVVFKDGKLYVGQSNAQTMVKSENYLKIDNITLDPNSVGTITGQIVFMNGSGPAGNADLETLIVDTNNDDILDTSITDDVIANGGSWDTANAHIALITGTQERVTQILNDYKSLYGGNQEGNILTIDFADLAHLLPVTGTIRFTDKDGTYPVREDHIDTDALLLDGVIFTIREFVQNYNGTLTVNQYQCTAKFTNVTQARLDEIFKLFIDSYPDNHTLQSNVLNAKLPVFDY